MRKAKVVATAAVLAGAVLVASVVVGQSTEQGAAVVQADRITPRISVGGKVQVVPMATGQWAYLGEFVLRPGAEKELERGDFQEEFLYVLFGTAVLVVDGRSYLVGPRMGIYLPPRSTVKWSNGPEPLVAVQLIAGAAPGTSYQEWSVEPARQAWPRPRVYPRPMPATISER